MHGASSSKYLMFYHVSFGIFLVLKELLNFVLPKCVVKTSSQFLKVFIEMGIGGIVFHLPPWPYVFLLNQKYM